MIYFVPSAVKNKGWFRTNHPKGEIERSIPCSPLTYSSIARKQNNSIG
jgi:hypothetical protein